ncbi:MAG: DUF5103 domain-containing protein [Chlorobi bacterium]|nr:DUF5103 domain-containing protein [Chlorobiota bacterium]
MKYTEQILVALILLISANVFSQNKTEYRDKIYKDGIKTVLFYRAGWEFTAPVLELNSDKKLILSFDDLNDEVTDYYYTVIHCSANWEPSDLNPIEYIQGYEEEQIENFENSFGTLVQYTHYTLTFPNENMQPEISGNYILLVYEDYDRNKPVLTRRFYVADTKLEIKASVQRASYVTDMNTSQELKITVTDKNNYITNPQDNFSATVLQNNDQNIMLENIKPDFIKGNVYEFYNPRKLKFKGGNEYRYFNVKSEKYLTERIKAISFGRPYYYFELIPEVCNPSFTYSYMQDINGDFLITADNTENPATEADYVYVDFTLYKEKPFLKGEVYVYGTLSDRSCDKKNKMTYDYGKKAYTLRMLLKQGFYNYRYVICDNGVPELDYTEGNYYQTENNYMIFIYNRPQGGQYDELAAYIVVNSLKIH